MTRTLVVLRPEPGNTATVARAQAAGFATLSLPLFAVRAVTWDAPDVAEYDCLVLTSANTLRFGGAALDAFKALPVLAVGPHTAAAARDAGFRVVATGHGDGAGIAARAAVAGFARALHLTGVDRTLGVGGAIARVIAVYESVELALDPRAVAALPAGATALLHSARAARRFAGLVDDAGRDRAGIAIAALSPAIAAAAGTGWAGSVGAATPDDAALFAALAADTMRKALTVRARTPIRR